MRYFRVSRYFRANFYIKSFSGQPAERNWNTSVTCSLRVIAQSLPALNVNVRPKISRPRKYRIISNSCPWVSQYQCRLVDLGKKLLPYHAINKTSVTLASISFIINLKIVGNSSLTNINLTIFSRKVLKAVTFPRAFHQLTRTTILAPYVWTLIWRARCTWGRGRRRSLSDESLRR